MKTLVNDTKASLRTRNVVLLILVLPMIFRTFAYWPVLSRLQEAWNVLCLLYLLLVYPGWFSWKPIRISRFDLYSITLIAFVPFLSAFAASREFGQPMLYGLLTQRGIVTIAAILYLRRAIAKRTFTLPEIERAMIILAWGTLVLFGAMRLLLDPSNYIDFAGFAELTPDGSMFDFQGYFTLFATLYYLFRGFRENSKQCYFLAFLIFACTAERKGFRQGLIFISLTFLFFVWRWSDRKRLLSFLPTLVLAFAILGSVSFAVIPSVMFDQVGRFRDVFTVVLTDSNESVQDPSAGARAGEALVALEGIAQHPILGNGFVSFQWQGGPVSVMGERFNAYDVGVLGVWYALGIVGLMLFAAQFAFIRKPLKILPKGAHSPLMDATKGFLFFMAVFSITGGAFVADVSVTLFIILLLNCIAADFVTAQSVAYAA